MRVSSSSETKSAAPHVAFPADVLYNAVMDLDVDLLLDVAERAAVEAGQALMAHQAEWASVEQDLGREVKIRADRLSEGRIIEALSAETGYRILSEEAGWVDGAASDLLWAVDPLDGSVNYLHGFPHWCVSIALVRAGKPILGVIECPALGELMVGAVGRGARLNGAPMRVSAVSDPGKGILMTGLPARASTDPEAMAAFAQRLAQWRKVRMLGSAACALGYVAAGRAELYHESGGMLWDVAAGCALVEAAGGEVRIGGENGLDKPLDVRAGNGLVGP